MQIEELPQGDSIRSTETHGDFLWGCEAISEAIGRNKRVTFWLLENGENRPKKSGAAGWSPAPHCFASWALN